MPVNEDYQQAVDGRDRFEDVEAEEQALRENEQAEAEHHMNRHLLSELVGNAILLKRRGFDLETVWAYVSMTVDNLDRILRTKGHETYGPGESNG